ncbi:MAG: pimeloyl-CoA dehydrogenase large subunit [Reyranella sp.]|jgi:alkylation response protein AidB-like acyl-CoA dehydrogenase|uniref:acyl-CoA dehydrogenase family protein n=1 Tax=Reyranella sp. TaxID=1929291 RepID=UPI001202CDA9|nr:acyl-CoA dehydrogenase family protein [Reyranella sp.]TAJ41248.1 MAG: pimeloyl-CoA dehydrogenase large subunit [Reyranella sp.]
MDLALKPDHKAFADEVRDFARKNLSPATKEKTFSGKHYDRDDHMVWQQALGKKGWLAYTWPRKFGGPGWDVTQRFLFENVLAEEGAPRILPFGPKMVGPVIYTFGNEEQKARFLPGIRESTVSWCQGYSEPGAGSDLANLRTRAVREGDHYIVNGQKTWTSYAHWGDWIFCLVRTNTEAKAQEGISFLLIDMKTPGVTVRPIIMLDGAHAVNDVFLDNVKVPVANLVGKENEGWTCAKFLLANERLGIAEVPSSKRGVSMLRTLSDDPSMAEKIADIDLQVQALEMSELRALSTMALGGAPGPEASILKVRGSEIQQRIAELAMEACGEYAAPYQPGMLFQDTNETPIGPDHAPPAAPRYFNMRKTTIYGGSTEVQKNIVSKAILGL